MNIYLLLEKKRAEAVAIDRFFACLLGVYILCSKDYICTWTDRWIVTSKQASIMNQYMLVYSYYLQAKWCKLTNYLQANRASKHQVWFSAEQTILNIPLIKKYKYLNSPWQYFFLLKSRNRNYCSRFSKFLRT